LLSYNYQIISHKEVFIAVSIIPKTKRCQEIIRKNSKDISSAFLSSFLLKIKILAKLQAVFCLAMES